LNSDSFVSKINVINNTLNELLLQLEYSDPYNIAMLNQIKSRLKITINSGNYSYTVERDLSP
jgi:hypothetical protein